YRVNAIAGSCMPISRAPCGCVCGCGLWPRAQWKKLVSTVEQMFGQCIRHSRRRALVGLGMSIDLGQSYADPREVRGDHRQRLAAMLQGNIDQPARVDHII